MIADVRFFIAYAIVDVLCLVITIIIASNVSRDSGSERQVRLFFLMLTANIVFVIFDALWAFLSYSGVVLPSAVMLSVVNGINLTSISFAAFFWLGYTLSYFESEVTNSLWLTLLAAAPAISVPILHAVGHVLGANVILASDGAVAYGFMHTVISCVPLGYLFAATAVALYKYRHSTTSAQRRTCLVFVVFMIAPALSGVVDMFIPNMPVAAAGIVISILFVMMAMQDSRISSDALTGLNNRRRAESFLESSIAHCSVEAPLCLFIIDMDDFKSVNDTYGHLEGDHALILMSDALRSVCARENAFTARWGGDEFMLICTNFVDDPLRVAGALQDALDKVVSEAHVDYRLSCSVGYSVCRSDSEDRARIIADADAGLYRNKRSR